MGRKKPIKKADKPRSAGKDKFQAAIDHLTEYGGVKGAVISDHEGLVLAGGGNGAFDPEHSAAYSVEVFEALRGPLGRLLEPEVDFLVIKTPTDWLTLARVRHLLLVVAARRQADDLLGIRINQALEMISVHLEDKYAVSLKNEISDSHTAKRLEEVNV
jgi:predicted regulator of Ras-like GTPase activity (Roadblock/LC7/MglB family)